MSKNVVVLGAGGFIGSWMSKYLMEKGYTVTSVDIKEHEWMERSEFCNEFLKVDLRTWITLYRQSKERMRYINSLLIWGELVS